MLFIATSNFPGAIDLAFLSRADLIVTIDLPAPDACKAILLDTLDRVARAFPGIAKLREHPVVAQAAEACVGLDGRCIRKAVIAALAHSREIAMRPESLTPDAVLVAIQRAQSERINLEGKR